MPVEFQDVLKANVILAGVILLAEQDQRDKFAGLVDTEIVSEMLVTGPVPPIPAIGGSANVAETGLVLTLHRDRIQVVAAQSRTSIERQYPTYADLERLAEVATYAIDCTGPEELVPDAFGFNIEIVYRPTEENASGNYIAERLFPNKTFGIDDWNLVAGAGKLTFEGNDALWNFTLEPRANDSSARRVYLSLNLHRNKRLLPTHEEILHSLQEIWERSRTFATLLDASTEI